MPIDLPSVDLPHDSRRQMSVLNRTRLPGSWLLAACTALFALFTALFTARLATAAFRRPLLSGRQESLAPQAP